MRQLGATGSIFFQALLLRRLIITEGRESSSLQLGNRKGARATLALDTYSAAQYLPNLGDNLRGVGIVRQVAVVNVLSVSLLERLVSQSRGVTTKYLLLEQSSRLLTVDKSSVVTMDV